MFLFLFVVLFWFTGECKKPSVERVLSRGTERIRTAVQAFAELCLATRPQCLKDSKNNLF